MMKINGGGGEILFMLLVKKRRLQKYGFQGLQPKPLSLSKTTVK